MPGVINTNDFLSWEHMRPILYENIEHFYNGGENLYKFMEWWILIVWTLLFPFLMDFAADPAPPHPTLA